MVSVCPQPPNLAKVRIPPALAFLGDPARDQDERHAGVGSSHDAETIWSMLSFLQILPTLTAEQYKRIVAAVPPDDART